MMTSNYRHSPLEIDEFELVRNYEQERNAKVLKNNEQYTKKMLERNKTIMEKVESEMSSIHKKYLLLAIKNLKNYEEETHRLEKELEKFVKSTNSEKSTVSLNTSTTLRLKEIEEKHKLMMKQEENLRLEQQQFKQTLCNHKELINKVIQDCEQYQQDVANLKIAANIIEELRHYKTLLLNLVQDIDVLLLTKSQFTSEDLQFAHNKQQESIKIKQKFIHTIQQQITLSKTSLLVVNVQTNSSQMVEESQLNTQQSSDLAVTANIVQQSRPDGYVGSKDSTMTFDKGKGKN